jgi:hypothetical protein
VRKAGREDEQLIPLFNIAYRDNAPMITVGAVIADNTRASKVIERLATYDLGSGLDQATQISIGVPPLTVKEKVHLDQLMPCSVVLNESDVATLGFRLKQSQIEAYQRFYKHYPTFGEVSI